MHTQIKPLRLAAKTAGAALTAAVTMLLLYPILHELGHIFAARAVGCAVTDTELFPFPSVSLDMFGAGETEALFIAAFGGWLPLAALLLPGSGSFYIFCVKATVALMCLFSGAESVVRGLIFLYGGPGFEYNDAVIMLGMFPKAAGTVFLTLAVQISAAAGYLLRTFPLRRTVRFLAGGDKNA